MKYIPFMLSLATGLTLGIAQYTSRLLLVNRSMSESLLLGGTTIILYLVAVVQWIRVLKSPLSLSGAYALVVLGTFIGLTATSYFGPQKNTNISIQDITGIILIAAGSALVRR